MDRRNFIKVMAGGSSTVLIPSVLSACNQGDPQVWLDGWKGPAPQETDIRWVVLSYAILAANPHNKQPWVVDLTGPRSFDLYVDQQRLLPQTDPPARQVHIGQGTFLENLELAARQYGYRADIHYFPKGEYGNTVIEDKPVASIDLSTDESIARDVLFGSILKRQSNKRTYTDAALTPDQLNGLRGTQVDARLQLNIADNHALNAELSEILVQAMDIETSDKARDAETVEMFRFSDDERRRFRDGFGIAQSGMTGFTGWLVETLFLSRESAEEDSSSFGEQSVDLTRKQAQSATAYGWISTASNTRLDQVVTGRAYERLNLTATALGIAMHPMSQVLQEYADMTELQRRFLAYLEVSQGHTIQMVFRLGVAAPVEHTPRRPVRDFHQV